MKILIDVGHPAHVHYFRNTVKDLITAGNEVLFTAKDKEVTLRLLDIYGFQYEVRDKHRGGMLDKAFGLLRNDLTLLRIAQRFKPDLFVSFGSPYAAHVSTLLRKPHIVFTDTEEASLVIWLTFPFSKTICTPSSYLKNLDPHKHVRFNGFFELAYLHPNYFQPDPSVLTDLGIKEGDKFIVLRFISWGAYHDVGLGGFRSGSEIDIVKKLEVFGKVFITSERKLHHELEKYRISSSPEKIHSLMYYSSLYVGEGGTMAVESALLGVPAIHIEANSEGIATGNFSGNFREIRDKYDLLYFYPDQKQAMEKALEILKDPQSKQDWQKKREILLRDKIDVAAWITDFIKRYPESFKEQLFKK